MKSTDQRNNITSATVVTADMLRERRLAERASTAQQRCHKTVGAIDDVDHDDDDGECGDVRYKGAYRQEQAEKRRLEALAGQSDRQQIQNKQSTISSSVASVCVKQQPLEQQKICYPMRPPMRHQLSAQQQQRQPMLLLATSAGGHPFWAMRGCATHAPRPQRLYTHHRVQQESFMKDFKSVKQSSSSLGMSSGNGSIRFKSGCYDNSNNVRKSGNTYYKEGLKVAVLAKTSPPKASSDEHVTDVSQQVDAVATSDDATVTTADLSSGQTSNEALDLHRQQERERLQLQRKKESQRQNALEAMRMAEERRMRKFDIIC